MDDVILENICEKYELKKCFVDVDNDKGLIRCCLGDLDNDFVGFASFYFEYNIVSNSCYISREVNERETEVIFVLSDFETNEVIDILNLVGKVIKYA